MPGTVAWQTDSSWITSRNNISQKHTEFLEKVKGQKGAVKCYCSALKPGHDDCDPDVYTDSLVIKSYLDKSYIVIVN